MFGQLTAVLRVALIGRFPMTWLLVLIIASAVPRVALHTQMEVAAAAEDLCPRAAQAFADALGARLGYRPEAAPDAPVATIRITSGGAELEGRLELAWPSGESIVSTLSRERDDCSSL